MMSKYDIMEYNSEKMNRDRFNRAMQLRSMCDTLKITDSSINLGDYMASIMRSSVPWDIAMQFFRDNFEIKVHQEKDTVRGIRLVRNNIEYSVQEEWFNWITTRGNSDVAKAESTVYNKFTELREKFIANNNKTKHQMISFVVIDTATVLAIIGILTLIK